MAELRGFYHHLTHNNVPQQDVDDLIFDGDMESGHVSQR
jgi:hypothetical protein